MILHGNSKLDEQTRTNRLEMAHFLTEVATGSINHSFVVCSNYFNKMPRSYVFFLQGQMSTLRNYSWSSPLPLDLFNYFDRAYDSLQSLEKTYMETFLK
jgi:hypothetical protein